MVDLGMTFVDNWVVGKENGCYWLSNARNWVANVVLKFHNDPTVNESEIVIFLRQVRWPAGKREDFRRREKNEIVRQRRLRSQSEK